MTWRHANRYSRALIAVLEDRRWGAVCAFVLAAVAMAPVLHAGFQPEDFGWLVLGHLSTSPWQLVAHNIDFVYFYRPVPMIFWWLTAHAFGTAAIWHNLADILLQAGNAALVCLLAARTARRDSAGWLAGIVFAALPAAAGTAAWQSDRFDPFALGFSLLALLAFETALEKKRASPNVGIFLLLALLSKEVAYATAAIMLCRLATRWLWRRESPPLLALNVVSAVAAALVLRRITSTTADTYLNMQDSAHAFVLGALGWWQQAHAAIGGFLPVPLLFGTVLVVLLAMALVAALARRQVTPSTALAWTGCGLLLFPAMLQWPVTSQVLIDEGSRAFTENLRFYYAASAGAALLLAAGYSQLQARNLRIGMWLGCILWAGFAFHVSRALTTRWAHAWRPLSDAYLTLGGELEHKSFPPGCRIYLDAPEWPDAFRNYADNIVKSRAAPDAPLQGCAIFAGELVYQTLVGADRCAAEYWPGLTLTTQHGVVLASRLGDLCFLQFATYRQEQLGQPLFRFRVAADGHAREIPD